MSSLPYKLTFLIGTMIHTHFLETNRPMSCKFSDKPKGFYRRGLWSPEEDEKLKSYISRYGHGCWSSLPPKAGLQRNGKSCRLRWINYLRPGLKRGVFTDKEEETILTLQRSLGNKWSQMAQKLPGRTDNEIKNYWHSYLKRKALEMEKIQSQSNTRSTASASSQETTNEVSSFDAIPKFFSQDNNIPKVLFAEWFSPDHHVPCQNNHHPMNTSLYMGELSGDSVDVNNGYKQDSLDDLVGFVDGMHHEFNSGTTFGKLDHVEIVSKGEICDDFNMYSDLIYY